MTRIGNNEHLLALVRSQLQRMSQRERSEKTGSVGRSKAQRLSSRDRVGVLNAVGGLSDEDFARSLVGALLAEDFGEEVSSSPRFQELVNRTVGVLQADAQLDAVVRHLRSQL